MSILFILSYRHQRQFKIKKCSHILKICKPEDVLVPVV